MRGIGFNSYKLVLCFSLLVFSSGCATTGSGDPRDPLEGFNRGVYSFNQGMDTVLFDPISKVYQAITPDVVDEGVSNFFSNLGEISNIANGILQLKIDQAGQTLAHWGVGPGPYLVAPFFGPTTLRDSTILIVDAGLLNPVFYLDNTVLKAGLLTLDYVDFKADLLSAKGILEEAALDEYEFVKSAYFEKRASQIAE